MYGGKIRFRQRGRGSGFRFDDVLVAAPPKRRILLRDLDAWHRKVQELEPFERKTAERQVGRLANLTQVLPELLTHMSAGCAERTFSEGLGRGT